MATRINTALFLIQLADAGLAGVPLAFGEDGDLKFLDTVPQATRDAVLAVLAAHNPADPVPDRDDVRDAYVIAKAATLDMVANPTDLAKARTAIVRQGQCLEALLLFLNRRIA